MTIKPQSDFELYVATMEQTGKDWLDGKIPSLDIFNSFKLNPKQIDYVNSKSRSLLACGGMSSGKSLAFIVKVILLSQYFPGSHFLVGRKTQQNAEETFMKDFMEVCPQVLYTHSKGYHKITFTNGSEVEFWGLDALQSGASTDIKKAEQKLKSHNFTFIFIDQLEEIEKKVFDALQTRMRRRSCTHSAEDMTVHYDSSNQPIYESCNVCHKYTFNQFCATMNPANHWSYDYWKVNPRPNTYLVESSTLDNKAHLTEQFIQSELQKPEAYKLKFFYGQWDDKSMVEGGVFAEEHILNQRALIKAPIRVMGGIRIFEEPSHNEEYQIGIDPSLGATDPCNITAISKTTGKVVATYTAHVPTNVIAEKSVQLALMYSLKDKPMLVPEATGVGQALVEALKPLYENIYIREVYAAIEDKKSSKLGFYTTHATKTQLIENMKLLFQSGFPKVYDEDSVNELNKFIYTDSAQEKGAGAQQGYHDDRVMGMMLAYWNVPPIFHEDTRSKAAQRQQEIFARNKRRAVHNSTK